VTLHIKPSPKTPFCAAKGVFMREPTSLGPLAPTPEKHILHDMFRFLRKWLLLRRLRHVLCSNVKQGNGFVIWRMQMRVARGVFAQQTVDRSLWAKLWGRNYQHRKLFEILNLLGDLTADGYIDSVARDDGKILLRHSSKGEAFCAPTEFIQEFFTRYDKAWKFMVYPIITIITGVVVHYLWPVFLHPLLNQLLQVIQSSTAR
jgi:hypothetical protein